MGRAGHPYEIAPLFIYLASNDSSYVTGQVMHVNGGEYKGSFKKTLKIIDKK